MTFAAADIALATQHLCHSSIAGENFDIEASNLLSAYDYAISGEHPGKFWWDADPRHPSIARVLKIDPEERAAIYALAPFRFARVAERPRILCALPCPHFFAPIDMDWLGIESVISWDPLTDTGEVMGDAQPQVVGRLARLDSPATIYGSPFAFFRAIAEDRARFAFDRATIASNWTRKPIETDTTPGLLLVGDANKARWPVRRLPETLTCVGIDARAVNRAILRQARVPHAIAAPERLAA